MVKTKENNSSELQILASKEEFCSMELVFFKNFGLFSGVR
jgi:hypothetical protein